jgi:hypothetical protein
MVGGVTSGAVEEYWVPVQQYSFAGGEWRGEESRGGEGRLDEVHRIATSRAWSQHSSSGFSYSSRVYVYPDRSSFSAEAELTGFLFFVFRRG